MSTDTAYAWPYGVVPHERIAEGVKFEHEHDPDWWREDVEKAIDLERLDLDHPCRCIFGQRYGNYWRKTEKLGMDEETAARLGFTSISFSEGNGTRLWRDLEEITDHWRAYIRAIRAAAKEAS